ncbi:hypothetical protein L7F22_048032 [Adiantum nelumboides]|nr:hypothetical protein [Adiantum nelumboides]
MQSRALLTKLIVRGLFPGNEPWKMLLQPGLVTVTPTYGVRDGHIWTSGMRFLFTDAPLRRDEVSTSVRSLLQIWNPMRKGLIRRSPRCKEEIERQPLIWNSYAYSTVDSHIGVRQQQLGVRTHIDWAVWDVGLATSYVWDMLQREIVTSGYIGRAFSHWYRCETEADVEKHVKEFMEAARKLQLFFISLHHKHQPSKEEALTKEIEALESELKEKNELLERQRKLLEKWRELLLVQKTVQVNELEKI